MKKILTLLTLFIMTFSSGYATIGEHITLTSDDILYANIFYINGEGYTKENGELKKIDGIKFYSIAGQRYIKKGNELKKVTENKIYKINNINYVKENHKLMTLEKYLLVNKVKEEDKKEVKKTFSDIFNLENEKKNNTTDSNLDDDFNNLLKGFGLDDNDLELNSAEEIKIEKPEIIEATENVEIPETTTNSGTTLEDEDLNELMNMFEGL